MNPALSNAKVVLLAVHLATAADVDRLAGLVSRHREVLRKDVVLRILLTCLPEQVPPPLYVPLLKQLDSGVFDEYHGELDAGVVQSLSDEEAVKKARRLKLVPLVWESPVVEVQGDQVGLFLLKRAYQIGKQPQLLGHLPGLLSPFFGRFVGLRAWFVSRVLPLIRRSFEYYPQSPAHVTLEQFQELSEAQCASLLLSQTGVTPESSKFIGRDLRGMIGPWLQDKNQWSWSDQYGRQVCPAFMQVLEWMLRQAGTNWATAAQAIEQWNGFDDIDTGSFETVPAVDQTQLHSLQQMYLQTALGCAYLAPEGTVQALRSVYDILLKVSHMLNLPELPTLEQSASNPAVLEPFQTNSFIVPKLASYMRNGFLSASNSLTITSQASIHILQMLCVSAFLLARSGISQTIKNIGDLVFFADSHSQQILASRYISLIANRTSHSQETEWIKAREELMWLRSWGNETTDHPIGVFGSVNKQFIESEFLKTLLGLTRHYNLARTLYEETTPPLLDLEVLKQIIVAQAMNAYDHASNPNRTRGGLKKCDEIIHAFPQTIEKTSTEMLRVEALLKATHALSEYSLVLKKGEPFTPVVLRAHGDPISILEKALEQNPKSYTKLQDFLDISFNLVHAGVCHPPTAKKSKEPMSDGEKTLFLELVERRVIAMCVQAALKEDDFETAYSYVVNRLSSATPSTTSSTKDNYAWEAALHAGTYTRTSRTLRPTHLGTGSMNPDIRHLEQRIECLSAALRTAPAARLDAVLRVFSRCEQQLDASLNAEAARDAAWEQAGDTSAMPGSFAPPPHVNDLRRTDSARSARSDASASAASARAVPGSDLDESMSLFDLSKATARMATRNLTALSGFTGGSNSPARSMSPSTAHAGADVAGDSDAGGDEAGRTRKKRDQIRDAAVGTLISGVGWLINAPAKEGAQQNRHA
ncbi:hypothetical protein BROUX41_003672 [Berkeleyomyces rouxiae]